MTNSERLIEELKELVNEIHYGQEKDEIFNEIKQLIKKHIKPNEGTIKKQADRITELLKENIRLKRENKGVEIENENDDVNHLIERCNCKSCEHNLILIQCAYKTELLKGGLIEDKIYCSYYLQERLDE